METRTATVGVTAIITAAVAAALLRPPSVSVSSESAPSEVSVADRALGSRQQSAPKAEALGQSGSDLLLEFFGPTGKPGAADTFELGILIATLPDPFDSHLDWSFDADLEAIRRAFETSDYVVDRFWLPGLRDSLPAGPGGRPVALREVRPGVMLFRGTQRDSQRLRILYLVPELPTRGVYKDALWAALERSDGRCSEGAPFRCVPSLRIRSGSSALRSPVRPSRFASCFGSGSPSTPETVSIS